MRTAQRTDLVPMGRGAMCRSEGGRGAMGGAGLGGALAFSDSRDDSSDVHETHTQKLKRKAMSKNVRICLA